MFSRTCIVNMLNTEKLDAFSPKIRNNVRITLLTIPLLPYTGRLRKFIKKIVYQC